jgi:repressor LexA
MEEKIKRLRDFHRSHGRVPSYREVMGLLGFASKNAVHGLFRRLEEHGYIRREKGRKVVFTSRLTGSIRLLGTVQAGFPSPAEEELVDIVSLDEFLVDQPEATFMLTVSGDSMVDAGIQPGDVVLVEKGREPRKDDIVVAQVDQEWTLKYFRRDRHGVFLDPANARYQRIRPRQSLVIGGVVRAVIRKYH